LIAVPLQGSPLAAGVAQPNHAMASVMAIKSEVFVRCVEEKDVYVDIKY